jgi:hypothetical protein
MRNPSTQRSHSAELYRQNIAGGPLKLAVLILLGALSACGQFPKQMAAPQVSDAIAKRGAKVVAAEMNHGKGPTTWSYVQEHVAAAEPSWLEIAAKLKPYTDAGNSEGLDNALADALPKAPQHVLGMLGETFHADRVCSGGQFIEVPKEKVIDFLKKAQVAVKDVHDPSLAKNKEKCLGEIETSLKALKAH